MNFLELATKVEGLVGACRNTDTAIWVALGACPHLKTEREGYQDDTGHRCVACGADSWGNKNAFGQRLHDLAPAYTGSIDGALSILPALDDMLRPLTISMHVSENGERFHAVIKNWSWGQVGSGTRCRSYPIALASAALQVRAAALTGATRNDREGGAS